MSKFNVTNLIGTLKDLTQISKSMRFNKVNGKIIVSQKNENLGFIFSFKEEDFPFKSNKVGFIDYREFISILSMLSKNAEIIHDENSKYITLSDPDQNIKVNYNLTADSIDLSTGPLEFNIGSKDAIIPISKSDFIKIRKFIDTISAQHILITVTPDKCKMKFYRDKKGDNFEMSFDSTSTKSFKYVTTADLFGFAPEGNVDLELDAAGIICMKYKLENENSLEIFTGIEEEE